MGWRDRLQPASFRGVAFKVDGHDHDFGRRVAVHEYPGRDKAWAEDLGKAPGRYRLDAYVLGPDYDQARDALIAACNAEGPAELVVPWLGARWVSCTRSAVREDSRTGGQASFTLEFVEDGGNVAPSVTAATQSVARDLAAATTAQAADDFAADFTVAGQPGFVLDQALTLNADLADQVEALTNRLAPIGQPLDALRRQLATFRSSSLALAGVPADLAGRALALVRQVRLVATTPAAALQALRPLLAFGSTLATAAGVTPARVRQQANQTAFLAMVRAGAAAETVAAVAGLTFDSYDAAAATRDDLAEVIDGLALAAADAGADAAWAQLVSLRQGLVADVTARGGSLARLYAYTPPAVAPALVIAHRLYGDAARDAELVARNAIAHPGFVPAVRALEVLGPAQGGR
ncbi:DNA circularization protein [Reyranella sp.]|uniref:DNA circularization protein n=1 Tax=Reyranella sp. TaxID=1929291 RepID=UPI0027312344|nr:DNA circularization N-terminal domain-containing protein [Reyranella sp.]MDP2375306.1 DNA circularization N-terminal domain-containing protein [Reyranella sp.]